MKLLVQGTKIIASASDSYVGPEAFITAPVDFVPQYINYYVYDGVNVTLNLRTLMADAVQAYMDSVIKTKGYGDAKTSPMLSACSYAATTHPRYGPEGRAALAWRSAVWDKCYQVMDQVLAGQRAVPTINELLAELPPLGWPVWPPIPVVEGPATAEVVEGETAVATFEADTAVTWSLHGTDAACFTLTDGALAFATAPSFAAPADTDADNVYAVTVRATNTHSGQANIAVTVTVTQAP